MLKRSPSPILSFVALILVSLACNTPGSVSTLPSVQIQSPLPGDTIPLDEPFIVSAVATDTSGPGIARIELFVNGDSIKIIDAPAGPQDVFDVALAWTPTEEGDATLTVVAYRPDGSPSPAAAISVEVVGMSLDPTLTNSPSPSETPPTSDSPLIPTSSETITGRIIVDANIRSGAGPFCDIIGGVKIGETINLLEYSADRRWFKTDYDGKIGWIFASSVAPNGNTSQIPFGNEIGCKGCGDTVCNLDETCDSCPGDCGVCCGNGVCQPEYGEDCGTCASDCGACCGNGQCEPGRGESCSACELDCGSCCGNGVCEPNLNETCATCGQDCGSCCGNGLCESGQGESCSTCAKDCGACCGNGLCESGRGETCSSCSKDCGSCPTEEPTNQP